jgi:hypothetical protein
MVILVCALEGDMPCKPGVTGLVIAGSNLCQMREDLHQEHKHFLQLPQHEHCIRAALRLLT